MRRAASLATLVIASATAGAVPASAQAPESAHVVTHDVEFPTNLAYAPDGRIFFTEKVGEVRILRDGRVLDQPFATFGVIGTAERGLLGIALHPDFPDEPWVYVYLSDAQSRRNRIVRIRADGDSGVEVQPVIDLLPAESGYHNGGEIAFGPDGMLYAVTGEAHDDGRAQDPSDLGGKVLRLTPEGDVPDDNPFEGSPVYSLGHRNSFGLCFDPATGQLWETENGPESHDEVNRIVAGENYGWPEANGPGGAPRFVDPVLDFPETEALTGCAVAGDTLWFGSYANPMLHRATIRGEDLVEHRAQEYDAITDLLFAPDGFMYVATLGSIVRFRAGPAPPSPTETASPTASPTPATAAASPSPAGDEGRAGTATVVVVAILLGLGIIAMRGRIRPPSDPPDPTRV